MKQYLELLGELRQQAETRGTRQGVDAVSVFGRQLRYDLSDGFPLLTTKKVFLRGIIHELLWFIAGDSNIEYLVKNDVHIWDEWPYRAYLAAKGLAIPDSDSEAWKTGIKDFADKIAADHEFAIAHGWLGPVYGHQWRHWPDGKGGEIDQLQRAIDMIMTQPESRRIIVSAWNVADIDEMAKAGLPPCHTLFQFYVRDGALSCQLYQRSADYFLGVPFNIASYALLTMMIAQVTGLRPGELVHTFGDVHLFSNHFSQADEQLSREPRALPAMKLNAQVTSLFDFTYEDFTLEGYDPHPAIKAPIAV